MSDGDSGGDGEPDADAGPTFEPAEVEENVYELASMLLLGESDIDALVAGAPLHTDNRPILEYSDMDLYNVEDVAPNLGRLLEYQQEDLLEYFRGTERELTALEDHIRLYNRYYRNYIELYEQQVGAPGS